MPPKPRKRPPAAPSTDIRLLDLILRVGAAVMMFVAGTWWALGRIVAEKLVTALAMPSALVWLLLLVCILAARRAERRDLLVAAAIPWTVLTLLGNSLVAGALVQRLEQPYHDVRPLQSAPFDTIVVLGGGTSVGGNGRVQGNTAGDRVLLTAQMFHAGLTKHIICSGHRITELNPKGSNPAEQSRAVLISLGVPQDAIELLEGRNTAEEMQLLGESFADGNRRVGLITSAWHLTRALRLAKNNNLEFEPLPADFITRPSSRLTTSAMILSCIPQDGAMWTTSKALKEYLGILVGR